jgi:tripartite-type tricarboxylate transporter receptor subunit TctC
MLHKLIAITALAVVSTISAARSYAQEFPSKPVRLVVPFAPGGGADATARMLAPLLTQNLKQQIIVDNRGGSGGVIGAAVVATAPADGYTVLYGTPGPLVTNAFLLKKLPYDPEKDFAPVTLLFRSPYVLVVTPSFAAKSVRELVTIARAKPGQVVFGSAGSGSLSHLSGELLRSMAKIDITHVAYRGTGPALIDVIGGQIPMLIDSTEVLMPHIRAGKVRALGVTTAKRQKVLPDVPAIAETVPGYEAVVFNYIAVRAGTPRPVVMRLNEAFHAALRDPAILEKFDAVGRMAQPTTPEQLVELLGVERVKWKAIIERAGIQPE